MKKIFAIMLAVTFLFTLVGCASPEKMFKIEDDALKFENAGYEISVITDKNEIYKILKETIGSFVQLGDRIDGTDLSFSDCRPLYDRLPEVCEKITGRANHIKEYENAPYEQIMVFYFETPSDAEQYFELFIPWFQIVQYSKASKEITYGYEGNIVYVCTIEAYDILKHDS